MAQVDDVELEMGSRAKPGLCSRVAESCNYREWWVSDFFGNCAGIADQSGIAVAPSHSCLELREIVCLHPEEVQEGKTSRRACGEVRRKHNESCSRSRGPESRQSYQRLHQVSHVTIFHKFFSDEMVSAMTVDAKCTFSEGQNQII